MQNRTDVRRRSFRPASPPAATGASSRDTVAGCGLAAAALLALAPAPPAPAQEAVAPVPEAPGAAPSAPTAGKLTATLLGESEVGDDGDPDGKASATTTIDGGKLCYDIEYHKIAPVTMAHIHAGAAGMAGDPLVTLKPMPTSIPRAAPRFHPGWLPRCSPTLATTTSTSTPLNCQRARSGGSSATEGPRSSQRPGKRDPGAVRPLDMLGAVGASGPW